MCGEDNASHILVYLLDRGALPNVQNVKGWTPLHEAVEEGQPEQMKILIERGANLMLRNYKGRTPFHVAVKSKETEIVSWLLENTTSWLDSWDNDLFQQMAQNTPMALETVFDAVRHHPHNRDGKHVIHYKVSEFGFLLR